MKILIVGAGRVGMRTARVLREEGHDVILVEKDQTKVDRADNAGFTVIHGDASRSDTIDEMALESVDVVGALTEDLTVNYTVCTAGNHEGCRTVMRIDDDYREEIYEQYASDVDEVVYPERLGAAGAKTALLGGDFNVVADLAEKLQILSVTIAEDAPAVGERVNDVVMPTGSRIYAHGRADEPMRIPLPGTHIEPGDRVAIIAERDSIDDVDELFIASA